MTRSSWP